MRNRKSIFAFTLLSILLVVMPATALPANNWNIINNSPWCSEESSFFQKTACEVRKLNIREAWKKITVDASPNGGIEVEGWGKDSIQIQARIQARAESLKKAEGLISEIDIKTDNNKIHAEGPWNFGWRRSWSVSYRLMVPQKFNLKAKALNGGIFIHNVNGRINAGTLNGGIKLEGLAGDVEAGTTNGGIAVELDGDRWQGKGLDVNVINGGIKLAVPDGYSAELEASTVNGGIKVDFPIKVQGWIQKSIKTTLGKGGATIKASAINGGVIITKK